MAALWHISRPALVLPVPERAGRGRSGWPAGILQGNISSGSAASLVAFSSCQPTCAAAQFRSTSLLPPVDFGRQGIDRQFAAYRHGMSTALCAWRLWQCAEGSKSHKYKALMPLRTSHASGYATSPASAPSPFIVEFGLRDFCWFFHLG